MSRPSVDERVRELTRGWTPPAELRSRVLDASTPLVRPAVCWSDRVWFSTRWRLAAAAALIAVAALEFTSPTVGGRARGEPAAFALQSAGAAEDVATRAGLAPAEARVLARRTLAQASGRVGDDSIGVMDTGASERGDAR